MIAPMQSSARELKQEIRKAIRRQAPSLSPRDRAEASAAAAARLMDDPRWKEAASILLYIPLGDELDLLRCVEQARAGGKLVALPRYLPEQGMYCAALLHGDPRSLPAGPFGVPEPPLASPVVPLNRLDLAIVPGVAFDMAGRRLGRGKGFYDRLLAEVAGIKCGVTVDERVIAELPDEPHDISMNCIVTPTRLIETARGN